MNSTPDQRPARNLRAIPMLGVEVTLSERLSRAPLSIDYALQCATDIANSLRELHAAGYVHGGICSDTVLLREANARLAQVSARAAATGYDDVVAYGQVLYQLVKGEAPPPEFTLRRPAHKAHRNNAEGLAAAMVDLAYRCVAASPDHAPDMQRVLMEVRLLAVLSRLPEVQSAEESLTLPMAMSAAAPAIPPGVRFKPARETPPSDEHCPRCDGKYVYPSKPRSWMEHKLELVGIPFFRCHRCYYRYCSILQMNVSRDAPLE